MESEQKGKLKFLITFLILFIIFISYSFFLMIYSSREKLDCLDYSGVEAIQLYNYADTCEKNLHTKALSNQEIKEEIQKIIKPKFYTEIYTNTERSRTFVLFRVIEIEKRSVGYNYAYILMHEYIHLDYLLRDESLVDFLTVKLMWESDCIYLKKAACWLIKDKIRYDNDNEYDCTAQLIEYFRASMN